MGLGEQPQEHFEIYTLIYVLKKYFQLLNWHRAVTYIILTLIINLILLSDATYHTERPSSPFDKIWRQGDKNLIIQTF